MSSEFIVVLGVYIEVGPCRSDIELPKGGSLVCPAGHGEVEVYCGKCGLKGEEEFSVVELWCGTFKESEDERIRGLIDKSFVEEDGSSGKFHVMVVNDEKLYSGVVGSYGDNKSGSMVGRGLVGSEAIEYVKGEYRKELEYLESYFEGVEVNFGYVSFFE